VLAYSRISRTGLSIVCPYQPSTVTWCETPSPSTIRPPDSSSIVAAVCAVAAGVREYIGSTPVPSLMRPVLQAYAASTVIESRAAMCVTYAEW